MKRTVVFILSTNYAGSNLLSLMLGSHSRILKIGEVKRLRRDNKTLRPCPLCHPDRECGLTAGITPANIQDVHKIIFSRFEDASVLIDNSKKTWWADRYIGKEPGFDYKVIHLIRDPRALVRRWVNLYTTPDLRARQRWRVIRRKPALLPWALTRSPELLYGYKWLTMNEQITRFIEQRNLDHRVITYHDLVTNAQAQLRELTGWLGLNYEEQQDEFWSVPQHGGGKSERIVASKGLNLDLRWQNEVSPEAQNRIGNDSHIGKYLDRLGVEFTPSGLTKMNV